MTILYTPTILFIAFFQYKEDTVYIYNTIIAFSRTSKEEYCIHLQYYPLLSYITRRILYTPTILFIVIVHYKEITVYTYNISHCCLTWQGGYYIHLQNYSLLSYIIRRILYTPTILFTTISHYNEDNIYTYNTIHRALTLREDTLYSYNVISYITRRILYTPTMLFIVILYYKGETVNNYNIIHCFLTL